MKEVRHLTTTVKDAVSEAVEEKSIQNGHLTADRLKAMFEDYHSSVVTAIDEKISKINCHNNNTADVADTAFVADGFAEGEPEKTGNDKNYRLYSFGGKMWHVPKNFIFPNDANISSGWRLWMVGQPAYQYKDKSAPVRPFRYLNSKFLPKDVRRTYKLHWLPIFELMCQAPRMNFELPVDESFEIGYEYLQQQVTYIFDNPKLNADSWKVSTWSMKVQPSSIMKHGSESDKQRLSPEKRIIKKRKPVSRIGSNGTTKKRRRKGIVNKETSTSQGDKRNTRTVGNTVNKNSTVNENRTHRNRCSNVVSVENDFENAFPLPTLPDNVRNADEQRQSAITAEVRKEVEENAREEERWESERELPERVSHSRQPVSLRCDIAGCTIINQVPHTCHGNNCNRKVHNLCCQKWNLNGSWNELEMFCSTQCKTAKEKEHE